MQAPNPNNSDWLDEARSKAEAAFSTKSLPLKQEEPWKYTASKLRGLMAIEPSKPSDSHSSVFCYDAKEAFTLSDNPLINANTAFADGGMYLALDEGEQRDLQVIHYEHGGHTKHKLHLAKDAKASVLFTYEGDGAFWQNQVMDVQLDEGAELSVYHLQNVSHDAYYTQHIRVTVGERATYRDFFLSRGAKVARHSVEVTLAGEGAVTHLDGAYITHDTQYADIYLPVTHQVAKTYSHQHYKGVLDDKSEATFYGKVTVPRDSQKIEAHQLNNNLLLSDDAAVNTRPALEIYADDVKCSHGATVGELDDDALYYLQARGLPLGDARQLLIDAFVMEMIDGIADEEVREIFTKGCIQ